MSSEFDSNLEEFDDDFQAADEIVEDFAEQVEDPAPTAEVSEETVPAASDTSANSRMLLLKSLTLYDSMLIASALCITLACALMALELTSFGSLFFQWRTGEAFVEALNP